jgi:hypothetical protein
MSAMMRVTFRLAAIAFLYGTAAAAPLVTFESPCECRNNHGKAHLAVIRNALRQEAARSLGTLNGSVLI